MTSTHRLNCWAQLIQDRFILVSVSLTWNSLATARQDQKDSKDDYGSLHFDLVYDHAYLPYLRCPKIEVIIGVSQSPGPPRPRKVRV